MILPPEFYQLEAQSKDHCTETPSGAVNVDEIIRDQPYWIASALAREPKLKKLILSDWTAPNWSEEKIQAVQKVLKKLLNEGFSLYWYQSNELTPITQENLSTLLQQGSLAGIKPNDPDEIYQTALTNKITRDQIHILNEYWLEGLLQENFSTDRVIKLSDYLAVDEKNRRQVISIINQTKPRLKAIIQDEFSENGNNNCHNLQHHFPEATCRQDYRLIKTTKNMNFEVWLTSQLINTESPQKPFEFNGYTFDFNHLEMIETIAFGSGFDTVLIATEVIIKLFSKMPNLKKIDLGGLYDLDTTTVFKALPKNLKEIILSEVSLSDENISELFAAAGLEKIGLKDCQINNLCSILRKLDPTHLSRLREIDLSETRVNTKDISTLLAFAPNLERINLSEIDGLDFVTVFNDLNKISLSKLREIDLSNGNLSERDIGALFSIAPNLEKIKLSSKKTFSWLEDLPSTPLKKLREISLNIYFYNIVNITALLALTPNLEKIDISFPLTGETISSIFKKFSSRYLSKLREIEIYDGNATEQDIPNLLRVAPNLEKIFLRGLSLAIYNKLSPNQLSKVKEIGLSKVNGKAEDIAKLLLILPSLELIELSSINNLTGNFDKLPSNTLRKLRRIDFINTDLVNVTNISALLAAAPNLEIIHLDTKSDLKGAFEGLSQNQLSRLKKINLYTNELRAADISALLAAAPNLDQGCKEQLEVRLKQLGTKASGGNHVIRPKPDLEKTKEEIIPHNHLENKDFKPKCNEEIPAYNPTLLHKNQEMIIQQLTQYLVTQNQEPLAKKIQDGMCNALVYFFKDLATQDPLLTQWNQFLTLIASWNGQASTLSPELNTNFDQLRTYVQNYQINQSHIKRHLVGENLDDIWSEAGDKTIILSNPWHSICVKKIGDQFQIYDPNYAEIKKVKTLEKLKEHVFLSIGQILSIDASTGPIPRITDFNQFIEGGGLLALYSCDNAKTVCSSIPADHTFSKKALEGLLLRNVAGSPAWVNGINSSSSAVTALTEKLIRQFKECNPDWANRLKQGAEYITALQRQETTTKVIQNVSSDTAVADKASLPEDIANHDTADTTNFRQEMLDLLRDASKKPHYEEQLSTWKQPKKVVESIKDFCMQHVSLLNKSGDKTSSHLIESGSTDELNNLAIVLQNHCKTTGRPFFYIDSPTNLICSATFVKTDPTNPSIGHLTPGPGGPLDDFLKTHKNPVLIVNYEKFKPDDIVRFNGLIDAKPHADGTYLPDNTVVIGLTNTESPDYYYGADFKSRFAVSELCPFSASRLANEYHLPNIETVDTNSKNSIISLYNAPDWQFILLGGWAIKGQSLTYQEGELQKAIKKGNSIEIHNGPWENEAFQSIWGRLRQGGVYHAGQHIRLPEDLKIVRSEGYNWAELKTLNTLQQGLSHKPNALILNSGTFSQFFGQYEVINTSHSLNAKPGYLDSPLVSPLILNVTATISEDAWARLLTECSKRQITLEIHCAPGVELPEVFEFEKTATAALSEWNKQPLLNQALQVIKSTDVDTTVAMLTENENWQVIDISECQVSVLLLQIKGGLKDKETNPHFEFTKQLGALLQAKEHKKNIILRGHFSQALIDGLAEFLLTKVGSSESENKMVIVSDHVGGFSFLPDCVSHTVTVEEKTKCLNTTKDIVETLNPFLETESLSQLQVRAAFLKMHPDIPSHEAQKGLRDLSGDSIKIDEEPCNYALSEDQSSEFREQRKTAVLAVLNVWPCVFLTGLSGIGKTTFVERELCDDHYQLFTGESQLKSWATDRTSSKTKLLFLDEANLSSRLWSELEGLFQKRRGILIEDTFYPLEDTHQIIFAGNPISYGDERQLAPFFTRHALTVLFDPLSKAVIYEQVLKPIFANQDIKPSIIHMVSDLILDAYTLIAQCSTSEVLISPRELQMMALLALNNYKMNQEVSLTAHTKEAIYETGKSLIPSDREDIYEKFSEEFKSSDVAIQPLNISNQRYVITESRQAIAHALEARLQLRQWRSEAASTLNDDQKYGGLGGIVLEGEPGIGKSELITHILYEAGYQKQNHSSTQPTTTETRSFYMMPVSMSFADKKSLLLKAFDEGAVVVIDEMNSSPMMEQYLNALLMGKHPETGERPKRPGFMVIGTQNPSSMSGRRLASTALQRRLTTLTIPEYTKTELSDILKSKGCNEKDADELVEVYLERRQAAEVGHFSPMPCFRDLLKLVPRKPTLSEDLGLVGAGASSTAPDIVATEEVDLASYEVIEMSDVGAFCGTAGYIVKEEDIKNFKCSIFPSFNDKNKILDDELYKKITKQLTRLAGEYLSCWPYTHKESKRTKMAVLYFSLELAAKETDIEAFRTKFTELKRSEEYSVAIKGKKISRTLELLSAIEHRMTLDSDQTSTYSLKKPS